MAGLLGPAAGACAEPEPPRIVLVGDSTMATRTGYGEAFCALFRPEVECVNRARGGRSTKSFRVEGLWDGVIALLGEGKTGRPTYVLIQFGHNDQPGKAERTTDLVTEFPANIERYVDEARRAQAIPVLVTPLTRRPFRDGVHVNDLAPWAEATRRIAREKQVPLLDLNADSAAAVSAMGSMEADALAMAGEKDFDRTHLGPRGAALFSRMVAKELVDALPPLAAHLRSRPRLSDAQAATYAYREVLKRVGPMGAEESDPWDPLADPLARGVAFTPDFIVDGAAAADGRKTFNTVQAAVSAAATSGAKRARHYILVKPGVYRELLYVPDSPVPITIFGEGRDAAATRISANLDAGIPGSRYASMFGAQFASVDPRIAAMFDSLKDRPAVGTPGSAVAWVRNHGFQARNITFENAFNKERGDWIAENDERVVQRQAVAMMVDGADRVQFENVRFIGFQDTLFLKTSAPLATARSFFHRSYIEGDMDFIFGDGTAYFLRSEIKSLGDRRVSYLIAPSTHYQVRYGFVFNDCDFTHDGSPNALTGTFRLARQWFRGQRCTPFGTVTVPAGYACRFGPADTYDAPAGTISKAPLESVGKIAILGSRIGAHIDKSQPWADWNADGTRSHRPVQYDSDGYWANLLGVGIDPVGQMGYSGKRLPVEPFLAEHRNTLQ